MKKIVFVLFIAVLLVVAVSEPAAARGRGTFVAGAVVGYLVTRPYYYPPPAYYYPPPQYYYPPPVYNYPPAYPQVPQVQPPQGQAPHSARFYCPSSNMYYPDTQACPGGWESR